MVYDQLSAIANSRFLKHNLTGDPCFLGKLPCLFRHTVDGLVAILFLLLLDGKYIVERQQMLARICDTFVSMEAEFGIAANTSTNIE
jgi:hypothetical protein